MQAYEGTYRDVDAGHSGIFGGIRQSRAYLPQAVFVSEGACNGYAWSTQEVPRWHTGHAYLHCEDLCSAPRMCLKEALQKDDIRGKRTCFLVSYLPTNLHRTTTAECPQGTLSNQCMEHLGATGAQEATGTEATKQFT